MNSKDRNGTTLLIVCSDLYIRGISGWYAAFKFLLEKGSDPNAICSHGNSPLFHLSIGFEDVHGHSIEMIQELLKYGADINR